MEFKGYFISHYTSVTVTRKLLFEDSPFRLSEATFQNDTSEGIKLFSFLGTDLYEDIKNNSTDVKFTFKPFIGSFVPQKKHNDLALWRMYGKEERIEAKGCSITINVNDFKKSLNNILESEKRKNLTDSSTKFNFYRILYWDENKKEFPFFIPGMDDSDKDIQELNNLLNELKQRVVKFLKNNAAKNEILRLREILNEISYLIKSAEYQYEHEIRLVVSDWSIDIKVDYKETDRVYIDLVPLKSCVDRVTLGPKSDNAEECAALIFYEFLKFHKKDLKKVPDVIISKLPFK